MKVTIDYFIECGAGFPGILFGGNDSQQQHRFGGLGKERLRELFDDQIIGKTSGKRKGRHNPAGMGNRAFVNQISRRSIFPGRGGGLSIAGQQISQVRARYPLQDAVSNDSRGSFMAPPAGKIGFAEVITGAKDGEVFKGAVAEDLVRLAPPADNPINRFTGVSFLKEGRAFSVCFDGRMIEQFLEGALGQKGEQREAF